MEAENTWKELFSAIREEEWDEAILGIDNLISKEPSDPEHFVKLGDLHMTEGNRADAVSAYKKAIRLFKKGNSTGKAMLACKKALYIDPDDPDIGRELTGLLKDHERNIVHIKINSSRLSEKEEVSADKKTRLQAFLQSDKIPKFLKESLDKDSLEILYDVDIIRFKAGDELIREGEPGDSIFIIVAGHAEVSILVHGKKVILADLTEGDIFGEMAFLTSKPRGATVTAVTEVELIELNKRLLNILIEPRPHILKYLFNVYTSRTDVTLSKLKKSGGKLSGHLQELPLSDLLQIFDQSGKKGTLFIGAGDIKGSASFKDGMIMDASFGGLTGEDALVELLSLKEGTFNYMPEEVLSGSIAKPVNFVLMETIRLIDERSNLKEYMPEGEDRFVLQDTPPSDDPETKAVAGALRSGTASLNEIQKNLGFSHIRTGLALARLIKKGVVRIKDQW